MLFVAEVGATQEMVVGGQPEQKQRLRVVFENGTESSMCRQTLSIRFNEADGRAIVRSGFVDEPVLEEDDASDGHLYILRSKSEDPPIDQLQDLHKIGFSRGPVEKRIKNAERSPTYLMPSIDVVANYRVYNVRTSALENLLHRVFAEVRLDITQIDRKGRDEDPPEWFVIPLDVIDQAIEFIISGDIVDYVYEAQSQQLTQNS